MNLQNSKLRTPNPALIIGFTLVELLIVTVLMLVLGGALLTIFIVGQTSSLSAGAYIQVQQEARKALDITVKELREAGWRTGKTCPAGSNKACVGGATSGLATQLDFQLALGYNLSVPADCPPNAVCWGAFDQNNNPHYDWSVQYRRILGPDNTIQMQRRVLDASGSSEPATPVCRILANYLDASDINDTTNNSFQWDSANRVVTIRLLIRYYNPRLPNKEMTSGAKNTPLMSRVRLRNPST